MHILARQVRFAIDPFGKDGFTGANSYAGKPAMEGFGLYGSLWVHLKSELNPDTGFVVNVSRIDAEVRNHILPFLGVKIRQSYARRRIPALSQVYQWLQQGGRMLDKRFNKQKLCKLEMELNPFRKLSIGWEKNKMLTYTEQFEFAAMHKLWNPRFDPKTNEALFGKCANPTGHGHNYVLAVTICPPVKKDGWLKGFQRAVGKHFLSLMDHKNLNKDVKVFAKLNPTVENIAQFAWKKLHGKIGPCKLVDITIWENDRTYCRYTED